MLYIALNFGTTKLAIILQIVGLNMSKYNCIIFTAD